MFKPFILPQNVKPIAWQFIFTFFAVSLAFMKLVPGGVHKGPASPKGNVPVYKSNGVQAFLLHTALFVLCSNYGPGNYYQLSIIYDEMGDILNALNWFALGLVLFLYGKGHYFPSSTDSGSSGNLIFDLYWGMELYPRILDWDIKMFTNCRFGMVYWELCTISCAAAAMELNGGKMPLGIFTSLVLQSLYILKFFWWETGYFNSTDIMQDRAGYYICWGCLVYLPTVYTSMTAYMVTHDAELSPAGALAIISFGLTCVWINYDADAMRANFRRAKGKYTIWGAPAEYITATYKTGDGTERESLLLLSGWWGVSRHFHYIPELAAALAWSCGGGLTDLMPWFYFIYLTILLLDRSVRDDARCRSKYGVHWEKYCERVPYKVIPGIF